MPDVRKCSSEAHSINAAAIRLANLLVHSRRDVNESILCRRTLEAHTMWPSSGNAYLCGIGVVVEINILFVSALYFGW